MTHYTEWRIWNGGECPVEPGDRVQVQFHDETRRDVEESERVMSAGSYEWQHGYDPDRSDDIIAYRIAIPAPKPRTFWIVGGEVYESETEANRVAAETGVHEVIEAREVL